MTFRSCRGILPVVFEREADSAAEERKEPRWQNVLTETDGAGPSRAELDRAGPSWTEPDPVLDVNTAFIIQIHAHVSAAAD